MTPLASADATRVSLRVGRSAWRRVHTALLACILAGGAILRLHGVSSWWSIYNDYDEGAWAMGGRLIAEGAVPYRDFLLVHPPLYEYVLAGLYKLVGFSFLSGRYLAAALSLATVVAGAWVANRSFGPRAALWAAFGLAFSPIMVFAGRRVVPDAFGTLLAVVAIGLALEHLRTRRTLHAALLGATLAALALTKYTQLMTAAAIVGALALAGLPDAWWARARQGLHARRVGIAALFVAVAYAVLFALRFRFDADVKLPLIDDFFLEGRDLLQLGLVLGVPCLAAWWVTRREPSSARLPPPRVAWGSVAALVLGGAATLLVLLLPVLASAPRAFLDQTLLLQSQRPEVIAPSLVHLLRYFTSWFQPVSVYQVELLLALPVAWLAFRRSAAAQERFVAAGLALAVLASQPLSAFPRYYIGVYPFLFLAVGFLLRDAAWRPPWSDARPAGALAFAALLVASSLPVPVTYWGYDDVNTLTDPSERDLNEETLAFLREAQPGLVYATSPTLLELDPSLPASRLFDTFAYLWLLNESPEALADRVVDSGVDVIVITPWSHLWGGSFGEKSNAFNQALRARASLLRVIGEDSRYHMEVYRVEATAQNPVFNPKLDLVGPREGGDAPLGWRPVQFYNAYSNGTVTRQTEGDESFTRITIHQSGNATGGDWAHAGFEQEVVLTNTTLHPRVRTTAMTTESNETQIESGMQIRDKDGHWLLIGFGGGTGPSSFERSRDDWSLTILPVRSGEWAEFSINVTQLWEERGWPVPERATLEVYAAAHWARPGDYSFDVARLS